MKRLTNLLSAILVLTLASQAAAQEGTSASSAWQGYLYSRSLIGVENAWHRVALPDEIYKHAQHPWGNDLRVIKVNDQGDTLEIPYLIRERIGTSKRTVYDLNIINQTQQGDRAFATIDLGSAKPLTNILLDFEGQNFDMNCRLEGSQNLTSWKSILKGERLLSIRNSSASYSHTELRFPTVKYRYLRISYPIGDAGAFLNAQAFTTTGTRATERSRDIDKVEVEEVAASKSTIITLWLKHRMPVSRLEMSFTDTLDFLRMAHVQAIYDTTTMELGLYRSLGGFSSNESGYISSLMPAVFNRTNDRGIIGLQVSISNKDNRPLSFKSAQLFGRVHELEVRMEGPGDYFMVYSNPHARAPRYDLNQLQSTIPKAMSALTLGEDVIIGTIPEATKKSEFQNWWIWTIIGVVILLLGFFSLKMLRE